MVYAYIRVSTDTQTVENQRIAINDYLKQQNKKVDVYYSDVKSGTIDYQKRELGKLVELLQEGDTLICTELSRLGRSLTMIFNLMQLLAKKKVKVIAIKNNFILTDNDITTKVLMFAFGLSAEIERQLISERTKQGLQRAKLNGKIIGHKRGFVCQNVKLTPYKEEIRRLLDDGTSINYIAKKSWGQLTVDIPHPYTTTDYSMSIVVIDPTQISYPGAILDTSVNVTAFNESQISLIAKTIQVNQGDAIIANSHKYTGIVRVTLIGY